MATPPQQAPEAPAALGSVPPVPMAGEGSEAEFEPIRLVSGPGPSEPVGAQPASFRTVPGAAAADEPKTEPEQAAPPQPQAQVQPVPAAQARAMLPEGGIAQERLWTQRNLRSQYDATASSVVRVLSEAPGLRAAGADAVTDLVAARLYLTGDTRKLDDAVRSATVGPHVPLARCIAAGLMRLPSYRGVARTCVELTDAEFQWYDERRRFTEWSFYPVLTSDRLRPAGAVELLIWSMTARRTALIDSALPEQAVFLPGTAFKVLRVGESAQRSLLLRELSRAESGESGPAAGAPLDEMALTALDKAGDTWRRSGADVLEPRYATRFGSPPGLIARPLVLRARAAAVRPAAGGARTRQNGSAPEGGGR